MGAERKKDEAVADDRDRDRDRLEALAALGEVSAGVTHEVRNAMTGILGFAQVALRRIATRPESATELLQLIESETQRCVELLSQFLSFTRPSEHTRAMVDVAALVRDVGKLMSYQLQLNRVRLEVEIASDLPSVWGDSAALKQVLINLLINAMQAIGVNGGRIVVTARRMLDGGAEIRVHDDGPGVCDDAAERVFEPFFTTKLGGKGTGLGLAVSRGIVADHGGTLTFENAPDRGAIFSLRLPAHVGQR